MQQRDRIPQYLLHQKLIAARFVLKNALAYQIFDNPIKNLIAIT
jgi:hypothetical protein